MDIDDAMRTETPAVCGSTGPRCLLVAALSAALLAAEASACALEGDDVMLKRVAVGYAYPDSLSVLGAVSSAQLSGRLDRMPGIDAASTSAQRRLVMLRINRVLSKLGARLADSAPAEPPALSIVLLEPMLWSRVTLENRKPRLAIHTDGPAKGDVIIVTEEPVLASLINGGLSASEALSLCLVRLYGSASRVAAARTWLGAGDPPARRLLPEPNL